MLAGQKNRIGPGSARKVEHVLTLTKYPQVRLPETTPHPEVASNFAIVIGGNAVIGSRHVGRAHTAANAGRFNVQTHFRQIGLTPTFNPRRKAIDPGAFRIVSREFSWILPSA